MSLLKTLEHYAHGMKVAIQWLGSDAKVVDQHQAQTRANVCLLCPQNQTGKPLMEEAALAVREQLALKNDLKLRVVGELGLHSCAICDCVLKLKVWCPIERVLPQPGDNFPENCWIIKETSETKNQSIPTK